MTFSRRVPADLTPNRFATTIAGLRQAGRPLIDLTESNPTRAGFDYPPDLLEPLADPAGLHYAPDPFGLPAARAAVADDLRRQGMTVAIEQLALTSSTSEAYSLLFKVLCDPGDEVLIPRPSYPLFDHLAQLDAIAAVPYDLEYHTAWAIDRDSMSRQISPRTRAVLLVSPNNPTGHFTSAADLDWLAALAAARGLAIISDEVFADYAFTPEATHLSGGLVRRHAAGFTLGGFSKSIGLPQAKLAWMVMSGPAEFLDAARPRLELACDTYLSVSTPVQTAARALLQRGAVVRQQIQARVRANWQQLERLARATPSCRVLNGEGGWYAVLQVPSIAAEEELVVSLAVDDGVLVHPGYFFDFPRESFLVLSLLATSPAFHDGVGRVLRRFAENGSR